MINKTYDEIVTGMNMKVENNVDLMSAIKLGVFMNTGGDNLMQFKVGVNWGYWFCRLVDGSVYQLITVGELPK